MLTRDQYSYSTCSSVDNGSFADLDQVSTEYTTAGSIDCVYIIYLNIYDKNQKSGNNSIEKCILLTSVAIRNVNLYVYIFYCSFYDRLEIELLKLNASPGHSLLTIYRACVAH